MNQPTDSTVFGMFVKQPVAGRVKTRLAASLGTDGTESAAMLYDAFQTDLVDRFRGRYDQRWLGFSPASATGFFENLSQADYRLWAQPDVDLGNRMRAFFEMAFANGAGRVVLIGSDSPTLPTSLVDEAFELLRTRDLVVGPATDGGYVLIGQSGSVRDVFDGIQWSQPGVLAQTVQIAQRQSLSVDLLTPWYDVDTIDDLRMLQGHISGLDTAGKGQKLSATRSALSRISLPQD